ncbi:MAG: hypothetical protein US57_C0002G0002 [Candidatus Moranbacteria bacterium GW2011_GWC2_37_73]|nr:MAG: hypothetical protein UR95_C0002G0100 [Parcubacteria group bacterium GW2011_GWC1_36_108]KKQ01057.1 MAG: hypothetical protein US09_C0003G0057 [Candidatus Moranbacteria bacterium GW2011_GWD1_36_198]KKQ02459.1 MAG: hypothetical protein US10_C0001G0057 [Candidatus Moranbacteria bacterium GW2011_GWD2_36_198]KKQ40295.1 MAG: hypothetical protein US57_C0002G0002 [Candidatus Moranbacteria bacterium GW2011_GWC2_37_73]HAS00262.1 hypothetical protein [Candidatus Moranbacteria bacterium]
MELTPKQKEIIGKKIGNSIPKVCPNCKGGPLLINDKIFELREFEGGNLIVGSESVILPVIAVNCSTCGQTSFFNAVILGLVAPEQDFSQIQNNDGK